MSYFHERSKHWLNRDTMAVCKTQPKYHFPFLDTIKPSSNFGRKRWVGRCPDKFGKPLVRPSIWLAKSKFESSRAFHSPHFDQSASRGAPERRAGPTDACFWLVKACRGFRVIFWLCLANCFTSKWHFWWMIQLLHQMVRNSSKAGRHFTLPLRRVQRKSGRKFEKFGVLEEPE